MGVYAYYVGFSFGTGLGTGCFSVAVVLFVLCDCCVVWIGSFGFVGLVCSCGGLMLLFGVVGSAFWLFWVFVILVCSGVVCCWFGFGLWCLDICWLCCRDCCFWFAWWLMGICCFLFCGWCIWYCLCCCDCWLIVFVFRVVAFYIVG